MEESQAFSDQRGRLPGREAARLADIILKKEKKKLPVNIILSSDNRLRNLNRCYRGRRRTTDVLAFTADPDEGILGEIYISVETARRQAKEYGITLREEILRLACHGVLHLCGYDHNSKCDTGQMQKLQEQYLSRFLKHV